MYTQAYRDESGYSIPDGYAGTMLDGRSEEVDADTHAHKSAIGGTEEAPVSAFSHNGGSLASLFKIPLLTSLKLGTEELLIGAVALFMLFSKDGDKECAIMLLLLLFVT